MNEYEPQNFIPFGYTPESFDERQRIKKSANIIGIALLILLAVSHFWANIYYLIMSKIGYSAESAYEIISEPAVLQLAQIILSTAMFTLPFILVVKTNGIRVDSLMSFKKVKGKEILPFLFIGLGFCAFANIATSFAGNIFSTIFGTNYDVDFGENPKGIFGFLLSLIATAIIPALVEEFACRGIILGILRKHGDSFAIIASALVFGLLHGNFEQMPFAFLVGLVLGYIVVKTDSLLLAIAVHSLNNLASVLMDYWNVSVLAKNTGYMIFLIVCMLFGIIGACLLNKADIDFKIEKGEEVCKEAEKYKWFLLSPCIIIFSVISLIEAVTYFFK